MSAEASIVSMSKRTVIVRIDVTNNGRLVCAAQGTVAVMPPRPTPDGRPPPGPVFPRT
jgi:acyl-coenzyme A thioesterase PaaI-like protein